MGGGGEPEKEEDDSSTFTFSLSLTGVRRRSLCDAPIRFLVLSHKAFAKELAELHRLVVEEAAESGSHGRELIVELSQRFEFLKLVYKYHCAAEDEVIFLALDAQVKNVVSTYSLEHKNIDDNFSSIFHCLHHLTKENGDNAQKFQELVCCVGSIHSTICQHMLKEEKQIFPLLEQKFSSEEQARLVWQYICSVPISILQDFLQWMTSLSADDKEEFLDCIKFVVPKEKLLQEVVISWIDNEKQSSSRVCNLYEKGAQFFKGLASFKDVLICSPKVHSGEEQQLREAYSIHNSGRQNPVDGIHLWHFAIRKDLNKILAELYQLRSSNNSSSTLSSGIVVRLKFFLDILIFYRNALDNVFYPVIKELPTSGLSPPYVFVDENQIEGLQRLLYYKVQVGMQSSNFMEMLCGELELFIRRVSRSLTFLEKEVFPLISANCTFEVQLWLLYSSLQMMPLGLLKHMVIWFSAHLSDEESKIILNSINLNHRVASKSFASLLHEWVRAGYSGKISIEKFRKDLQDMFKSRSYFLSEDASEGIGSSDENSGIQLNNYNTEIMEPNSALLATNSILAPSSSNITEKYDISYSSGMNLLVFFPQMMQKTSSLQYSNSSTFADLESRPMDHVLLFHKALIKDLEFLVLLSAKLFEDVGLLDDFKRRFHLLQFLYQIHSDSEDEIAFPALESKGKLQNVSHSYTIDHKLEVEQFRKILHILNEISSLQGDLDTIGQRKQLYHHLCLKLHDTCISMHKILSNHIHREEIELWPLFRLHFSVKEQEKIVGHMLGRLRAEMLQEMIPWLMESITPEEQHALFSLWLKATKNTKFSEWLGEWWEGMRRYGTAKEDGRSNLSASLAADPLEVVSMYLFKGANSEGNWHNNSHKENSESHIEQSGSVHSADQAHACSRGQSDDHSQELTKYSSAVCKKKSTRILHGKELAEESTQNVKVCQTLMPPEHPFLVNQEELETAVRRVSRDSTLDPKKKAFIIQNLLMSRWIVTQKKSNLDIAGANDQENIPGKCPSYRDHLRSDFGCKHYKRNCKLLAPCCNMLHTCIRCHDEMMTDHSVDRKAITKMMCMKCLVIQPLSPTCSTPTCDNFTMAKYFCKICKLYDDERHIYHCPYCNLCRVGKGLGIDYFHCMNCNACMARSLTEHICREKCFEDNCPICHEYIFTSSSPVKALPCGHLMHSACFQDYTCIHYTCPICSKSLGDMQVYFQMLDALLAEEKIPEEYSEQTQVILCNDCEKRGTASFHWHYHKCPYCGSYNTRLL